MKLKFGRGISLALALCMVRQHFRRALKSVAAFQAQVLIICKTPR